MGALFDNLQEFLAILELPSVNLKNDGSVAFKQGKHWKFYSNSLILDSNKLSLNLTPFSLESISSAKIPKLRLWLLASQIVVFTSILSG